LTEFSDHNQQLFIFDRTTVAEQADVEFRPGVFAQAAEIGRAHV